MTGNRLVTALWALLCGFSAVFPAYAQQSAISVRAQILQCGQMNALDQACAAEEQCCKFLDMLDGQYLPEDGSPPTLTANYSNPAPPPPVNAPRKKRDPRETAIRIPRLFDTFFAGQDANGDNSITLDEFTDLIPFAPPEIFFQLDRDRDFTLSRAEFAKLQTRTPQ